MDNLPRENTMLFFLSRQNPMLLIDEKPGGEVEIKKDE